jgi:hypothetical protein
MLNMPKGDMKTIMKGMEKIRENISRRNWRGDIWRVKFSRVPLDAAGAFSRYFTLFHRIRIEGLENVPKLDAYYYREPRDPRRLIV